MVRCVFPLLVLKALHFLQSTSADGITTQPTVVATIGKDARLSCSHPRPNDTIVQVTWQKYLSGKWETVASYSKVFGIKVKQPFRDKVEYGEDIQLWKSSIIIRNMSVGDGSCYRCLFSGNPDGVVITKTCLRVSNPAVPTPALGVHTQSTERHNILQKTESHPAVTEARPWAKRELGIRMAILIAPLFVAAVAGIILFNQRKEE